MKDIGLYLRLSLSDRDLGEDGKNESNSIENQRLLLRKYVEEHEELIGDVVEYVDDGYTGMNFNRPAFIKMVEDAKKGKLGMVIVKDLSRLGRDYIGVGDYLEQIFPSLNVRVVAINSRYDSNEYLGSVPSMDVSINNMINNLYSRDLSRKIKTSFRAMWQEGKDVSGSAPFGYYYEKNAKPHILKIDEEAAETVRLIFEKAAEGWPPTRIARHLNDNGLPTPNLYAHNKYGRKLLKLPKQEETLWDRAKVSKIIRSQTYVGDRVHGKRTMVKAGSNHVIVEKKEHWVITENCHPPIVSRSLFEEAQASIKNRKEQTSYTCNKKPFERVFKCGYCGRALNLMYQTETDKYLYCNLGSETGYSTRCSGESYYAPELETNVLMILRQYLQVMERLGKQIKSDRSRSLPDVKTVADELNRQLEKNQNDLIRQYENYANGSLSRDEFLFVKEQLNKDNEKIKAKMEQLEQNKSETDDVLFDLNRLLKKHQSFSRTSPEDVVCELIESVYVYGKDNLEIHFTFEDLFEKLCQKAGIILTTE